jgi:type II secretory pathway predicted ATPase ExeA
LGKLLQIILAGQPELDRKLDAPNLRQLKQRIVLRCHLKPFRPQETQEYINSRIEKAGVPDQTFIPEELIREVHLRSQGLPRVINALCDNLLLSSFAQETKTATVAMLDEICADMRLEWPGHRLMQRQGNDLLAGSSEGPLV